MNRKPTHERSAREHFRVLSRRRILQLGLAVPAGFLVACSGDDEPAAQGTPTTSPGTTPAPTTPTILTPTPSCDDGDDETPHRRKVPTSPRIHPSVLRCSDRA